MYKFLLTAFFLCSVLPLFAAHNGSINGQLTENESGLELAGATIRLDPGAQYTTSNTLGFFSFNNLPAGVYTLTINYIGFENKILKEV